MEQDFAVKGKLVFIMGGGKFGTRALRYMKANGAKIFIADENPECEAKSEVTIHTEELQLSIDLVDGQAVFIMGNAVKVLLSLLETKVPDLIVTAIPGNAVAKVVESWLAKQDINLEPHRKIVPKVLENIPKSLLSFVDKDYGVIVVSYMPSNLQCIENCLPHKDKCVSTGKLKLVTMDRLLEFGVHNLSDVSSILVSRQLTGGLGGIDGKELNSLLKKLDEINKPCTLSIGTACECHGVVNLVKLTEIKY